MPPFDRPPIFERASLGGRGIAGVLHQIHDHLLQLAGRTRQIRSAGRSTSTSEMQPEALHHPAHRRSMTSPD
jgi:hypothetical protein